MHPGMRNAEDVDRLENVLEDVPMDGTTRRSLLKYAAASAAAAGVLSPVKAFAASGTGNTSAQEILDTAITAEALAVTYLSGLIQNADKLPTVKKFETVLKAANQAEYDHYTALKSLGAKPITTKFWAPNAAFEDKNVFPLLEKFETVFVNAYLFAATNFAEAGMVDPARYAGEISGVESQHRTLVRFAQGELPNNVAFEQYPLHTLDAHVKAITDTGVGLGQKGATPGKFYMFPGKPPAGTTVDIENDTPA